MYTYIHYQYRGRCYYYCTMCCTLQVFSCLLQGRIEETVQLLQATNNTSQSWVQTIQCLRRMPLYQVILCCILYSKLIYPYCILYYILVYPDYIIFLSYRQQGWASQIFKWDGNIGRKKLNKYMIREYSVIRWLK